MPQKLHRLMKSAGFEQIGFADRYTAIKIHFGELGNLAYLRPQYAKAEEIGLGTRQYELIKI